MNKIKIYVLLACLWAVSALQAQNFGSEAMRKLQMAEFAIRSPARMPTFSEGPLLTGCTTNRVSSII
jgi:hypothetical protein